MSNDLLPCPFCGGEAAHNEGGESVFGRMWWTVGCKTCDIWFSDPEVWSKTDHGMLDPAYPPKHCFTAWNRRAALPAREVGVPTERPDAPAHIVEYTNWRGETARRTIIPIRMWWGSTEWHPEEQWMLTAWDVEKDAARDFAWQDMRPVQNGATSAAVAAQRAATDAREKALREAAAMFDEDSNIAQTILALIEGGRT